MRLPRELLFFVSMCMCDIVQYAHGSVVDQGFTKRRMRREPGTGISVMRAKPFLARLRSNSKASLHCKFVSEHTKVL